MMTKEAKIGMLTGLGVIVLIGVLLSEYLGDKNSVASNVATGRMAPLNVGADYRGQITNPVGVPAMAPAGSVVQYMAGTEIAAPVGHDSVPGGALAADSAALPADPVAINPVKPIEGGPVLADARMDGPPVFGVKDRATLAVKLQDPPKPAAVTHTVVAGDTLAKIARQYYGSAKNSDVQKIVAANPGVLKDAATMLVVNKKLVIPGIAPPTPAVPGSIGPTPSPKGPPAMAADSADGVIVYKPSSSMTEVVPPTGVAAAKSDAAKSGDSRADIAKADASKDAASARKTYVVQSGDTLEKIARKFAPTKTGEMVQKLMSLNGIKDPTRLQAGASLKMPA
jgi:nucleoid-associated protein YgaU